MSLLDVDAIEARANAATIGPWFVSRDGSALFEDDEADVTYIDPSRFDGGERPIRTDGAYAETTGCMSRADAEFIAGARNDIPALVAEVRRLRAGR